MKSKIEGKIFVVGDNVDTDQIIPAEYLSYNPANPEERRYFGKFALSGLPAVSSGLPEGGIPFVQDGSFKSRFTIIIAGKNFGCGSSREHAPLALAEAGCQAIVAQSYARIFYRNCVNGGYLVPFETNERLIKKFSTGDAARIDTRSAVLQNLRTGEEFKLLPLGDVGEIISAGGLFNYARKQGIVKR